MLTMHELVTGRSPLLRHAGVATSPYSNATAVIRRIELCDEAGRMTADGRTGDILAILQGSGEHLVALHAVLRTMIARGVIALVLTPGPGAQPPAHIAVAAQGMGLTVLLPSPSAPPTARLLRERLLERQIAAFQEATDRRDRLMTLGNQLYRRGRGPDQLIRALATECGEGARVQLLTGPAAPGWAELALHHEGTLDRIRSGQVQVETVTSSNADGTEYTLLCAAGTAAPHQVLAASRPGPWFPPLRDLVVRTATIVRVLSATERRRVEQSKASVRVSVLRLLMTGHHFMAMQAGEPLAPGVLSAETGRVAIVRCAPDEDRAVVVEEIEELVNPPGSGQSPRAIVLTCPMEDGDVIILMRQRIDGEEGATDLLARAVAPGRVLGVGVSTPEPWSRTSRAYKAAHRAVISARQDPRRISVRRSGTPMAPLLPSSATTWAHTLVRRLRSLPRDQRDRLVKTARQVLTEGARDAGKYSGIHPTTAGSRLTTVMECLGLDKTQLADRAICDLALQLAEDTVDEGAASPGLHKILLDADEARQQAERFLAPLDDDGVESLTAWIASNTRLGDAAEALGIHRNSLSARLDRIGSVLKLPLGRSDGEAYEVLWALLLTSRLPTGLVPDPTTSNPEAVPDVFSRALPMHSQK
ncbi:helix-turn-helix domain-containing protein [Streptomyces niveus]|uniref:helix-turn-helix domain-containing protein n=1 Tax=Streptomyces niveus TaxID=193462 RepID=UPI003421C93B